MKSEKEEERKEYGKGHDLVEQENKRHGRGN